jgi:hypothetical protein
MISFGRSTGSVADSPKPLKCFVLFAANWRVQGLEINRTSRMVLAPNRTLVKAAAPVLAAKVKIQLRQVVTTTTKMRCSLRRGRTQKKTY